MSGSRSVVSAAVIAAALAGCGQLQDFGGVEPPLATFTLDFTGDLTPLRPAGDTAERGLRVAIVWAAQWLTEPFCILPAASPEAAAVIAAGCRDPFGFVPSRVDVSAPLGIGQPVALTLDQLPTADVLVGDVTSRVAYASLIVFDDRNGSGTLELSRPHRSAFGRGDGGPPGTFDAPDAADIIYGATFVTMTAPDQRIAYREGAPPAGAFYPRAGCPAPAPGFSIAGAGGFSATAAVAATLAGMLPPEDPATCTQAAPAETVIELAARAPADIAEVGCDERVDDGSSRYRQPPVDAPDFTGRTFACAPLPSFDTIAAAATVGAAAGAAPTVQLVVSGRTTDRCKGLTHYTLRGCFDDVSCVLPDWDFTATPPSWWPCSS